MNNEITKLLDIITPEIFNQYMDEFTAEKSAFVQSGIAVADERVSKNITSGGLLVNMPFWTDLNRFRTINSAFQNTSLFLLRHTGKNCLSDLPFLM